MVPLVFKTSVGREERPGCVRFAHASAMCVTPASRSCGRRSFLSAGTMPAQRVERRGQDARPVHDCSAGRGVRAALDHGLLGEERSRRAADARAHDGDCRGDRRDSRRVDRGYPRGGLPRDATAVAGRDGHQVQDDEDAAGPVVLGDHDDDGPVRRRLGRGGRRAQAGRVEGRGDSTRARPSSRSRC